MVVTTFHSCMEFSVKAMFVRCRLMDFVLMDFAILLYLSSIRAVM